MASQLHTNSKRIATNSLYLYFRMLLLMVVSLFTTRVVLQSLGVQDYGIYNVVGGIIAMFGIIRGGLSDASQRFLTFEIGLGENGNPQRIFSGCIELHFVLGIIIVLLAEPIGLWFLYNKLQIPEQRLDAAFWVFQISVISAFIIFVSIPYNSLIIAHERMKAFAMITIIEAGLKLFIAYAILLIDNGDRLIVYAVLILFVQIINRFCYTIYSHRHFKESRFKFVFDLGFFRQIGGFAFWALFGNMAYVLVNHGLNLLLGTFFLPVVNAARGISVQVQGAVDRFVSGFQTAVNPQITKYYASGSLQEMKQLVFRSSKMSVFLLLLPIIPIWLEVDYLLSFWLTKVPAYTSGIIRCLLIVTLFNALSYPLSVAAKATGNIKLFESTVVATKLMVLPLSYVILRYGCSPIAVFVVYVIVYLMSLVVNLLVSRKLFTLSLSSYFKAVIGPIMVVLSVSVLCPILLFVLMPDSFFRFLLIVLLSLLITSFSIYYFGMSQVEKLWLKKMLYAKLSKKVLKK